MPRRANVLAVKTAREVIDSLEIRSPSEIDVELIAAHHNVLVRNRPLAHEEGRLVRSGDTGIITVSTDAYRSAKWRFVIAHELGHFLRDAGVDQFNLCTDLDLHVTYRTSSGEAEANDFAAELLMPERWFKKACDVNRPNLHHISEQAKRFTTSLTSAALRFVRFCPEPCAVVCSRDGVVVWLDWSQDFKLPIRKGHQLTMRTYAGDLFFGATVADRPQCVDADAWSEAEWASRFELWEHSRQVSPSHVLTWLWHAYPG